MLFGNVYNYENVNSSILADNHFSYLNITKHEKDLNDYRKKKKKKWPFN